MERVEDSASESGSVRRSLEAIPAELKHAVQEGKRISSSGLKSQSMKMSEQLFSPHMTELEAEFLEEETVVAAGAKVTSWNQKCNLLHPHSGARRLWERGILLLMLWIAIAEPLRMALLWVHKEWSPYDTLLTAWLLLDVVGNLCTGLVVNRRVIRHPKEVAVSYLRGWGPLDVLVALPWTPMTGFPRARSEPSPAHPPATLPRRTAATHCHSCASAAVRLDSVARAHRQRRPGLAPIAAGRGLSIRLCEWHGGVG